MSGSSIPLLLSVSPTGTEDLPLLRQRPYAYHRQALFGTWCPVISSIPPLPSITTPVSHPWQDGLEEYHLEEYSSEERRAFDGDRRYELLFTLVLEELEQQFEYEKRWKMKAHELEKYETVRMREEDNSEFFNNMNEEDKEFFFKEFPDIELPDSASIPRRANNINSNEPADLSGAIGFLQQLNTKKSPPSRPNPPKKVRVPTPHRAETNHVKYLWRSGVISKPEYVQYCNKLNTLHRQFLQGVISSEELVANKLALLDSTKKGSRTYRPSSMARPPPVIKLELRQPSKYQCCELLRRRAPGNDTQGTKRRRWKKERRLVSGGIKIKRQVIWWLPGNQGGSSFILDRKRSAILVVTGTATLIPVTQRQLPSKRRRRKRQVRYYLQRS
jgi:hypothetical protein